MIWSGSAVQRNGFASVAAAPLAVLLAMSLGFRLVLALAVVCYLSALGLAYRVAKTPTDQWWGSVEGDFDERLVEAVAAPMTISDLQSVTNGQPSELPATAGQ